eukprot:1147888-Pelagomonas_calceolata.AAC.2
MLPLDQTAPGPYKEIGLTSSHTRHIITCLPHLISSQRRRGDSVGSGKQDTVCLKEEKEERKGSGARLFSSSWILNHRKQGSTLLGWFTI